MAEFTAGDRVVKMSGVAAGRYGTVNSVREDGTLNVTFDGERMARFCDPERCGKVAANATFKKGDRVIWKGRFGTVRGVVERPTLAPGSYYIKLTDDVRITPTQRLVDHAAPASELTLANAAANAVKFDNPNYKPEAGMKYLDEHFQMFDPKVAKAMIDDAKAKGIKIPMSLVAKAQKAGIAVNAKFKVGDRISYTVYGQTRIGTVVEVTEKFHYKSLTPDEHEGEQTYMVDFGRKPYSKTWESRMTLANSRACNRASVYEYGVGDTVKLRSGRTGEVLSKYVDKDGNLSIEINLNGTRYAVSADMVDSVVKNARACNAEITPELKKAYDEWMKAKAKFDKWWNPNRRLSENPPKGADAARKQLDFAAVFKKVTGKLTPNGYGSMTLEQMVDAVS